MYPVSQRFLDTLAGSHPVVTRALLLDSHQFGAAPTGVELPILDGDVKMSSSADVKATLDLTVPGDYWDVVQPYGAEVWVARGVGFGGGESELVPLGYFRIDDAEQDSAPYGPVRLSCADRTVSLQQNRVLFPYQVPEGLTHRKLFERLINGRRTTDPPDGPINTEGYAALLTVAIPITWTGYDPDRATVTGGQVVEDSIYDFLSKLADNHDSVLRFDELGALIVDRRDRDPGPAVYTIAPGKTGNLIKASRKTTRDGVYHLVSAYGSDPAAPVGYQLAYNNDVNSPLFWSGLFSPAPRYYASPFLRTPAAAADAAATLLSRYTGLPTTVGLWTVPNPALRPQDAVSAQVTGLAETHLIDDVTIPLVGDAAVEIVTKTVNEVIIPTDPTLPPSPTPDPTPGTPPPVYTQYPGALHNIGSVPGQNHFNLGVGFSPNNPFGSAAVHHDYSQAEIEAGLVVPGYYEMDGSRVLLTCHPDGGKTSSNTNYSRVEYRELDQDGTTKAAWNPSQGTHYVKIRSAVESPLAAAKPQAVLAQMHNASDDTGMIYVNNSTTILAKVNGVSIGTLSTFTLGTEHDGMIKVVNGQAQYFWDDLTTPGLTSNAFVGVTTPQYFKAGDYMQWNLSNGDSTQCKVHMVSLEHWHTGWPQPARPAAAPTSSGGTGGASGGGGGGQTSVPAYDHIVVLILENHDAADITGSSAPYVWSLATGGAWCNDSHGVVHPSEGDYIALFSGSTQGMTDDTGGNPGLTVASIWSQLGSGNNCKWYSEDRPADVHSGTSGNWVQWHVAMSYFAGTDSQNLDWSAFPTDYTQLPKLAFVSPNLNNDMHDGSIATGDTWVQNNLGGYAQWAQTHNSLLIVTFDESGNDADSNNPIFTAFYGAHVPAGTVVTRHVDHYDVLRTIEAAFGLPGIANAGSRTPILEAFTPTVVGTGGGGTGTSTGAVGDGTQAAIANNWGPVIDGDEFDYTGSPNSKWSMYDGPGHDGNGIRSPSAFTVANGVLTCYGDAGGTTGGMAFGREEKYCRVEWRVRAYSTDPSAGGNRYHPVLIQWPTSDQWPQGGEYDFYEVDMDSGLYEAYLHIPGNDGSAQEHVSQPLDLQNWHNIAFEWAPSGITGWVDAIQVFHYTGSYIQAPGSMHATFQSDNFFGTNMCPAKFESMWFRVYTRPS